MAVGAGDLRTRIAFQQRDIGDDGFGGEVTGGFADRFTVWAAVRPLRGGEAVQGSRLAGRQPVAITVRSSSATRAVDASWRVRDVASGQLYDIQTAIDPDGRRAWVEILALGGVAN